MDTKNSRKQAHFIGLMLALALVMACVPIFVGDAFQTLKLVFKLNGSVSVGEDKVVQIVVFPESVKTKRNFVQVSGKLVAPGEAELPEAIKVEAVFAATGSGAVKQRVALTLAIESDGSFIGNKKIKKNIGADQMMTVTVTPSGSSLAKGTEITLCVDLVKPKSKLGQLPACVEEGSNGDPSETLTALQSEFFSPTCALAGCHSAGSAQAGMSLAAGQSFGNLVNVPSSQISSFNRVTPFDPENSYLIKKLRGDSDISGDRMPRSGNFLTAAELARFVTWINEGALNN